jgi:prepilin-type processing-associated H-X9-DG protein
MLIEAGDAVPWTKPEDIPYDPNKPLPELKGPYKDRINYLFCDGSTQSMPTKYNANVLRLMIDRKDGMPFNIDDLRKP